MSKMLFVGPASNLQTQAAALKAIPGQEVTLCVGNVERDKLDNYLQSDQYEIVTFFGHGDYSILELSDGRLEVQDLLIMLDRQARLLLVVIVACNSARVGAEIHNRFHIPVIMFQCEVEEPVALSFLERFFRAFRSTNEVDRSVEVARATLAKDFPAYADAVVLLDGDMMTDSEADGVMRYVTNEIGTISRRLEVIEKTVNDIKGHQARTLLIVGVLLLAAQLATPWLNSLFR